MTDDTTPFDDEGVSNGTTNLAEYVTSRPDGLDPTDVDGEQIDVDEELRKRARYEALHTARANAAEALEEASFRVNEASRDRSDAEARMIVAATVRDTVRRYVLELEPYLTSLPVGRRYWEETPLGSVTFDTLRAAAGSGGLGRGGAVVETREPDPVRIVGLAAFVEAPDRFTREVHAEAPRRRGTVTDTDRTVEVMPREVSRRAFRAANQFASDAGLDIQPRDGQDDAAFSVDDL